MDIVKQLLDLANKEGVEVTILPNNHFQIHGKLLVNYYPISKRRTAYVRGTIKGRHNVTPKQAIAMAFEQPSTVGMPAKRRGKTKAKKENLLKKHPFCHWCNRGLTTESATLEHIIPLKRGGLDNANNRVLACRECNHGRGCNMPELKIVAAKIRA